MRDKKIYIGIDLATQTTRTAITILQQTKRGIVITRHPRLLDQLKKGESLPSIIANIIDCAINKYNAVIAIDAPFGWPKEFVSNISRHTPKSPMQFRIDKESLRLRATDRFIKKTIKGCNPISVSSDKLASTAIVAVQLLSALKKRFPININVGPNPLCESREIIEVYPKATMLRWFGKINALTGYKKNKEKLEALLHEVSEKAKEVGVLEKTPILNDHELDSFVAALTAVQYAKHECDPPSKLQQANANQEGWIWIPKSK